MGNRPSRPSFPCVTLFIASVPAPPPPPPLPPVTPLLLSTFDTELNCSQALEASYDCDPHEVVCSKLLKKLMEPDWRTVAKAL